MRVLLIDDHQLLWNGTRRLLEEVAREVDPADTLEFRAARDVAEALQWRHDPVDLVLLDYHLPGEAGLGALRTIQSAFDGAPVCMLSGEHSGQRVREVLAAGAAGFIPKSYTEQEMAAALRLVLRHRAYIPAEFLLAEEIVRGQEADEIGNDELRDFLRHELSPRQRQVLRLALQGLPNKSIGRRLDIAEGTVKVHLSMVYRALGVRNRVGALYRVLQADAAGALE
jgi:RNA polymerase sigma factor (sigma-70 family)